MPNCKVTVFMAVFNGEKYIREAIDSILAQTYHDFELLLIDDGSTDNSVSIIKEYTDARIRLLQNESNLGLFLTRNRGIEEARGEYFATLDCDDIATKNRLELQLRYFHKNRKAAVCAGRVVYIDKDSKRIGTRGLVRGDQQYIRALLLFTNIFINSSTMVDTAVLRRIMYRKGYEPAEDYDLFERISAEYDIGMMNDILCAYRMHDANVSTLKSHNRKIAERDIIERQLMRYGFKYNEDELNTHLIFTTAEFQAAKMEECSSWFKSLSRQNHLKKIFHEDSFQMALAKQWLRLCLYKLKTEHSFKPLFSMSPVRSRYLMKTLIGGL